MPTKPTCPRSKTGVESRAKPKNPPNTKTIRQIARVPSIFAGETTLKLINSQGLLFLFSLEIEGKEVEMEINP